MDEELCARIEHEAEKHALFNALTHDSDADVGAVMGPLMGENPAFREHADEVPGIVGQVVAEVNDRSSAERRERLEALDPAMVAELDAEPEMDERTLPELPNVNDYDEVRMRCAPNPNGPWHIGHARMPAVIGTYAERYDGSFIVRFDDTNPETGVGRPVLWAYDEIIDEIGYLGFEPDDVIRASDRLEIYYEHARELIERGGAYTCTCSGEEFSALKNAGEPCPHRETDAQQAKTEFEAMVDGEYDSGELVLRIRTDIEHKNPALRDWVAFRIIETPHPREEASDYRCWPMLDFQSGIDDHLTGISHIIRGIDLQDSAKRQGFVYEYFEWEYPEVIHWGHVQLDDYDVTLSTSTIKQLVDEGELDGWDDPRAPTLMSVRRRGIRGEAITEAMVELGTSTSNVDLSMSSIYAKNRELIDDEADRLFFVSDPVEKTVLGGPEAGEPPVHPDYEDRGTRRLPVERAVLIEPDDVPPNGARVWLKGFGCVRHTRDAFEFVGRDLELVREGEVDVVHWVPATANRPLRLRTPTGDEDGFAETTITAYEPDDIVQFERVGFARIDSHDDRSDRSIAYYAHR